MSGNTSLSSMLATELGKRVMSGILMLIAVLWLCWLGGWPFTILSLLLSALLYYEWQAMVRQTPFDGLEAVLTLGFAGLLICSLLGGCHHRGRCCVRRGAGSEARPHGPPSPW